MEKFKELLQGEVPLLVDFYASWCGPCKTMHPIVEQVKSMLGDKVRVVKYDVDEHESIASLYHVRMIPTLILFKKAHRSLQAMATISLSHFSTLRPKRTTL